MRVKTGRDLPVLEVTKDNYIVPTGEEHLYHCRIEVKKFNAETGERQSQPRIQKFGATSFRTSIKKNLVKQGYTIDILHDPTEFLQMQNAPVKEKTAAPKATDEQVTQSLIDAAVAKALREEKANQQKAIDAAVAKALKEQKGDDKK